MPDEKQTRSWHPPHGSIKSLDPFSQPSNSTQKLYALFFTMKSHTHTHTAWNRFFRFSGQTSDFTEILHYDIKFCPLCINVVILLKSAPGRRSAYKKKKRTENEKEKRKRRLKCIKSASEWKEHWEKDVSSQRWLIIANVTARQNQKRLLFDKVTLCFLCPSYMKTDMTRVFTHCSVYCTV